MPESLVYQRKQILFNLPVWNIFEKMQADSIKEQIARLYRAFQKMKNFSILPEYIAMFLDIFDFNAYFAGPVSWKLH